MKKLLSLFAVLGMVIGAQAQNHISQSLLTVASLQVTNLMQATNLLATGSSTTNKPGTLFTNLAGTLINPTNGGSVSYAGYNLFKDATLWADRNGNFSPNAFNTAGNGSTNQLTGFSTVFIRLFGKNAAANSAVTFYFTPIWDGTGANTDTYLNTADAWSVAVTASGTTPVLLATNVPTWRWPGASGLRLQRISNGDTDASSEVWVDRVSLNGFKP